MKKTALSGKTKPAKAAAAKTAKPAKTNPQTSLAADDADEKEKEGEQDEEECACAGEEDCECDQDEEDAGDEAGEQAAAPGLGAKFLTAFGDMGGVWFAQGKTFEEAQELHTKHLQTENTKLAAETKELRSKLKLAAGEETPVGFSAPAPSAADKARAQLEIKVGSKGLAAFAAGIKLPGQS